MNDTDTNSDTDSGSSHCQTPDDDGEVADEIAIVSFERKLDMAEGIECDLTDDYDRIDALTYHDDMFTDHRGECDCFVGFMTSGAAMWGITGLLSDKWEDPAVTVVDEELTQAIPLTDGRHGASQVTHDLSKLEVVPAMTTASEATGEQGAESRAKTLDPHVVSGGSTVAMNLAALNNELGPVTRLDGPKMVLVGDDVIALKRNGDDGAVLRTGSVSGAKKAQFPMAWGQALGDADYDWDDVDFVATGMRETDESRMLNTTEGIGADVVCFERKTLTELERPAPSWSKEPIGWFGIAEASAITGSRDHELVAEKRHYNDVVTVAVGR